MKKNLIASIIIALFGATFMSSAFAILEKGGLCVDFHNALSDSIKISCGNLIMTTEFGLEVTSGVPNKKTKPMHFGDSLVIWL